MRYISGQGQGSSHYTLVEAQSLCRLDDRSAVWGFKEPDPPPVDVDQVWTVFVILSSMSDTSLVIVSPTSASTDIGCYSDVQATVRIDSLPIEIEETRVLKNPEWTLEGRAKVEMGSTLSIILRDDRCTHWAGIYVAMWINGDIVYSEALNRNHPRLNGYVWSDDRAFIFTGDKPFTFNEEHEVISVRVGIYSIKGGDNGIDFIPMAWTYLFPDRPPLFSFLFELECVAPTEKILPPSNNRPPVQVSTTTTSQRKKSKKRKDSGFGPGANDEDDNEGNSEIYDEVEAYLRQLDSGSEEE